MKEQINSIEKALKILLLFTPYNHEMGTVEISRNLGFHKATVSRILTSLTRYGFLQQNPDTKKFRLGQSAVKLGFAINQSISSNNIVHIAKPYIDELRDKVKETVVLEVLLDGNVIIADIAEGPGPIRIRGVIGDRRPAHAAAGAKAILAFSSPQTREKLMGKNLDRFTPNTIVQIEKIRKQLQEIRKKGFAVDNEEVNLGINAVGVPIFDLEKKPVAAVVAAGLSQAVTWNGASPIVPLLKEAAAKISAELYYKQSPSSNKS